MGKEKQEYLIRFMQEGDVKGVATVEYHAFPSPWPESLFAEELNNPLARYLVMEHENQIIGYAGFWLVLGEAQVTNIALLQQFQGQGLGKKLVAQLLSAARASGADSIVLEVRPSNAIAQNLYKAFGFAVAGTRAGYYQDNGEDALIMQMNLEEKNE